MNKYVKLATVATTAAVMGMSTMSFAEEAEQPPQMERIVINGGGSLSLDQDGNVDAEVLAQMVFNLSESAKIEITSDLAEVYGDVMDDKFDIDNAIKEGKVSFDVDSVGRVVLAIKMDINSINMSALDADGSLAGEGLEGVAAVRVHMKSAYLDGLVVTASETADNGLAVDTGSVRVSARAAKSLGMVTLEGELGYTFNDVTDDEWDATLGMTLDLSEQISGLEAFAQGTVGTNGLEGFSTGLNFNNDTSWSYGVAYEEQGSDKQVRAGLSKTFDNGHIGSAYVAVDTRTKDKKFGIKYEIPLKKLWSR